MKKDRSFTPLQTIGRHKRALMSVTGFTLVELLIATSIYMVIMVTLSVSFNTGIFGYRRIENTLIISQTATKVLERINLDLRNALVYSSEDAHFKGGDNELSFLTLVDTFRENKKALDYASVSYKLEGNELLRFCRRNQESLNDKIEALPQILAANLKEILFDYGYFNPERKVLEWKDTWDANASPAAVKVNLTLKNKRGQEKEPEQSYQRIIFLPMS